jgi:glycosyltransferase involved in cell wall biosynthesis
LGGARNEGVKIAQGEYLLFIDSDDFVDITICEELYNKASETDSDMVYCNYYEINEENVILNEKMLYPIEYRGKVTLDKQKGFMSKATYACGKLFKRTTWINNNIHFPEHLKYEDAPAVTMFLMHCKYCDIVCKPLYYYLKRESSITNERNVSHHEDSLHTTLMFVDQMKKEGLYNLFSEELERFVVARYYLNYIKRCLNRYDNYPFEKMKQVSEYIKRNYPHYRENKYYLSFTGEDRLIMEFNDINPRLAALWYENYKSIMKKEGRKKEGILYYEQYYETNIAKIIVLLEELKNKKVGLWGAGLKRLALYEVLKNHKLNDNIISLIQTESERVEECEVVLDNVIDSLDNIIVVNPTFYISIYRIVEKNKNIPLINFEDYLNDYIELDS